MQLQIAPTTADFAIASGHVAEHHQPVASTIKILLHAIILADIPIAVKKE